MSHLLSVNFRTVDFAFSLLLLLAASPNVLAYYAETGHALVIPFFTEQNKGGAIILPKEKQ